MSLSESKRKLEKIERYLELNKKLEEIVDDGLIPLLNLTCEYLSATAQYYKKIIKSEEIAITYSAQTEGLYISGINRIAQNYNLDEEEVKRIFDKAACETEAKRKIKCNLNIITYKMLSYIVFPFSRNVSSQYRELSRINASILQILNETIKLKEETEETRKIKEDNLKEMIEAQQDQAKLASTLCEAGFDERTADKVALDNDLLVYGVLENLKNRYGLE